MIYNNDLKRWWYRVAIKLLAGGDCCAARTLAKEMHMFELSIFLDQISKLEMIVREIRARRKNTWTEIS